ncbi:MAG: DUF4345 domain-containing protein [Chloroflexi bacterium]|nr:DUF4345 domain-containing protein [Chloroflexota bacterium]
MTLIQILQIIACVGTALVGLIAIAAPTSIAGFTGLEATSPRATTELRSGLGGFYLALGVIPLVLSEPAAFTMLGITYLVVAVVRTVSMFVDGSVEQSNIISIVSEIVLGVILLL